MIFFYASYNYLYWLLKILTKCKKFLKENKSNFQPKLNKNVVGTKLVRGGSLHTKDRIQT